MKKTIFSVITLMAMIGTANASSFTVSSKGVNPASGFKSKYMLNGFGCTGGNVSPPIKWSGAPKGTKSYAVSLYDLDAPTGSGWWHWTVYNIPANVHKIPAGAGDPSKNLLPAGAINGPTDFGKAAYGGPCPGVGKKDRYRFTVTALKVAKIKVPANATAAMVSYFVNANALGQTTMEIPFQR